MSARGMTAPTSSAPYWVEDSPVSEGLSRFRARIGGLHCSLCTGTIETALGRLPGVRKVAVSLTHEQALVEYDRRRVSAQELLTTLKDIGYTIWDPRKVRPYEEEEAELVREGKRLLAAIGVSLLSIALLLEPRGFWSLLLDGLVGLGLAALAYLLLRSEGRGKAVLGMTGLGAVTAGAFWAQLSGVAEAAAPWVVGLFAVAVVFGLGAAAMVSLSWLKAGQAPAVQQTAGPAPAPAPSKLRSSAFF